MSAISKTKILKTIESCQTYEQYITLWSWIEKVIVELDLSSQTDIVIAYASKGLNYSVEDSWATIL